MLNFISQRVSAYVRQFPEFNSEVALWWGMDDVIETRADKRNFIAVAHVQGSAGKTGQSFTVTQRHQIDRVPVTSY